MFVSEGVVSGAMLIPSLGKDVTLESVDRVGVVDPNKAKPKGGKGGVDQRRNGILRCAEGFLA